MTPTASGLIEAAGGVVWRSADSASDDIELAIVHRPKHDDWSLPKGKLEPGEFPICAAVREIIEETGLVVMPGRRLPDLRYDLPAGPKRVRYWSMHVTGGAFAPNIEVDTLRWIAPAMSQAALGQGQSRIVEAFVAGHVPSRPTLVLVGSGADDIAPAYGAWRVLDAESVADIFAAHDREAVRIPVAKWPAVAAELGASSRASADPGAWVLHRGLQDGSVIELEHLPGVPVKVRP